MIKSVQNSVNFKGLNRITRSSNNVESSFRKMCHKLNARSGKQNILMLASPNKEIHSFTDSSIIDTISKAKAEESQIVTNGSGFNKHGKFASLAISIKDKLISKYNSLIGIMKRHK